MDRREQRVRDAEFSFRVAARSGAGRESIERARMALREAVILMEANHVQ